MAQTLKIDNYSTLNIADVYSLDADAPTGSTTLTLKDSGGLITSDYVILGQLGQEGSEQATVSTVPNATSVTLPATSLVHKRFEPVTKLFANQIKIYRAPNVDGTQPADASFAAISTVNIDFDENTTSYTDPNGSSNYWYKYTYYNSGSTNETQLSDSNAVRGGGYGHYCSIEEVRREAGMMNNTNISDAIIDSRRIDAEQEINSELFAVYSTPFAVPVPALVKEVNRLIAAGLLLKTEYGPMTTGGSKVGDDKLNAGRELLRRIKTRELTLIDATGNSLIISPAVSSWPNSTTDQSLTDATYGQVVQNNEDFGPAFRKSMRF